MRSWGWTLALALATGCAAVHAQQAGDPEYQAAAALAAAKKHAEAAPALEKFLAQFPRHPRAVVARLRLADSLAALERTEPAARSYESVLGETPPPDLRSEALLGAARARLALKQDDAAETHLSQLFEITRQDPRNGPTAALLLADLLLRRGKYPEAVRTFDRMSRWPEHPEAARAYFGMAEAHRLGGGHADAAATYRGFIARFPRSPLAPRACLGAAESFLVLREFAEAEAEYRRVLTAYTDSPEAGRAQLGLGRAAHARGLSIAARAAYQTVLVLYPALAAEADLRIAESYLSEGDWPAARRAYEGLATAKDAAIAAEAVYGIGLSQQREGQLVAAEETFRKLAASTSPWSRLAQVRLAEVQVERGAAAPAITALRALLAEGPEADVRDQATLALAEALFQGGNPAEAEKELAALAHSSGPTAHRARIGLARCRLSRGDAAGSLAELEPVLKADLETEVRAAALLAAGRARLAQKPAGAEGAADLRRVVEEFPGALAAREAARALLAHYRTTRQDGPAAELEALVARRYGVSSDAETVLARAERELPQRPAEALALFTGIIQKQPAQAERLRALAGAAEAAALLKNGAEADRRLAEIAADQPPAGFLARARFRAAQASARAGQPDRAIALYNAARSASPDAETAPAILLALARLNSEAGKPEQAEQLLRELLNGYGKSALVPEAIHALASTHLARGRAEAARPVLVRLVTGHPNHPLAADASFRLGEQDYDAGRFTEAAARYRAAAASTAPVAQRALFRLGWAVRRSGDHPAAAKAFSELVTRFPKSELAREARVRAGEAYLAVQEEGPALAQFEAALAAAPETPRDRALAIQARAGAAWAYLLKGDTDRALPLAEEAANPAYGWYGGRAHLVRAEAVARKEGLKAGAAEFARAAELYSRFRDIAGEAHFRAGECQAGAGDNRAARTAWERATTLCAGTNWAERCTKKLAQLPAGVPAVRPQSRRSMRVGEGEAPAEPRGGRTAGKPVKKPATARPAPQPSRPAAERPASGAPKEKTAGSRQAMQAEERAKTRRAPRSVRAEAPERPTTHGRHRQR